MSGTYDEMAVSPSKKQSLLSSTVEMSLLIVSGKGLVALGSDGLTSNCMCEAFLVSQGKPRSLLKTKVAKMTRNPIWNCPIDIGNIRLSDFEGIELVVRHSSSFSYKEMGNALIPNDFFLSEPNVETWFDLQPTTLMTRQPTFRPDRHYGEICVMLKSKTPPMRSKSQGNPTFPPAPMPMPRVASSASTDNLSSQVHNPLAELTAVRDSHQSMPMPGETWYVISAHWVEEWLTFVSNKKNSTIYAPGSIPNSVLIDVTTVDSGFIQVRKNLELRTDFRLIDPQSWALYREWLRSRGSVDGGLLSPKSSVVGSRSSVSTPSLPSLPSMMDPTDTMLLGSLKARKKKIKLLVNRPQIAVDPEFNGVIYQSRIKLPLAYKPTNNKERWLMAAVRTVHNADALLNTTSLNNAGKAYKHMQNGETRHRCAESLYKLSKQPNSELMIIQSGAIQNIADLNDVEDTRLAHFCAATLANLTATPAEETLSAFVANKGISVLLETSWSPSYDVIELSSMLSLPQVQLQKLCVQTLINMISHGCEFPEKFFAGGGSNAHNNLGIVLALSQLSHGQNQRIFTAECIFNMSLQPSSASGAVRGGVGELMYTLIHVSHVHLQNRSHLQTIQSIHDIVVHEDELTISRLISKALANISRYIDLQLLLGAWCTKATIHFLALFESMQTMHSGAFEFVLAPCTRVLANLSSNDEYVQLALVDNDALVKRTVDIFRWTQNQCVESLHNSMRTLANLTRNAHCTKVLVKANILSIINSALLLPPADHIAWMKEDAIVALVNIACHQLMPESSLNLDAALSFSFRSHKEEKDFCFSVSKAVCYWTFDPRLRTLLLEDIDFVMEALLFGFYYIPTTDANPDPFHAVCARIAVPLDNFDELITGVESQLRFLAAMSYCASEIRSIRHVKSLVDIIATSMTLSESAPCSCAIEYYCAGILFALSRTLLWLYHNEESVIESEWASVLLAENMTQAIYTLSRSTLRTPTNSPRDTTYSIGTQAYCATTLYHICASKHTNSQALAVLVAACKESEDSATLMACASTFAIVSFTDSGRQLLLNTQGLAHALNKLGRTSVCQQHAAIAACNVAIAGCIWNTQELKDFVVVALLRSNSSDAIQVHAKTLYNLLSHPTSRLQVIEQGVLYSFLKLTQLQTNGLNGLEETLSLCLHALFNLSDNPNHHETLLKLGVTPFLFTGVSGRRKRMLHYLNPDSRRYTVGLLCNLSSRQANHKELIQNGQVIELLSALCDGDIETRASGAMTLRNLTLYLPSAEVMCSRNALSLMLIFMSSNNDTVRQLAAQALGNCSLVTEQVHIFQQLNVVHALLNVLESHSLEEDTAAAILKTLHNLALDDTLALHLVQTKIIARWNKLQSIWLSLQLSELASATCCILSKKQGCLPLLAAQQTAKFCTLLSEIPKTSDALITNCLHCLASLSTHVVSHHLLFEERIIATVESFLALPHCSSGDLFLSAAVIFRNMTLSTLQFDILHPNLNSSNASSQLMHGLRWLITKLDEFKKDQQYIRMCTEVCVVLANLSKLQRLRNGLIEQGALKLLLSIHSQFMNQTPTQSFIQQCCTVTLHRLAAEESATMEPGLIEALLSGLEHTDSHIHEGQREESKVSTLDFILPNYLSTSQGLCRQSYRQVRWVNYIVQALNAASATWELIAQVMPMNRIRGPLPALQDAKDDSGSFLEVEKDNFKILGVDVDKKDVDSPVVIDPLPSHDDSKVHTKPFDRQMKTTRRN
ncbi:hypothetical protein THRCLA_07196, partial [Thraustotheca clavata]